MRLFGTRPTTRLCASFHHGLNKFHHLRRQAIVACAVPALAALGGGPVSAWDQVERTPFDVTSLNISVSGSVAHVSWHANRPGDSRMLVGAAPIADGYAVVSLQCLSLSFAPAELDGKMESSGTSAKMESSGTSAKMESSGTSAKMESSGTSAKGIAACSSNSTVKLESAGTSARKNTPVKEATAGGSWSTLELVFDKHYVSAVAKSIRTGEEHYFELPVALGLTGSSDRVKGLNSLALN